MVVCTIRSRQRRNSFYWLPVVAKGRWQNCEKAENKISNFSISEKAISHFMNLIKYLRKAKKKGKEGGYWTEKCQRNIP